MKYYVYALDTENGQITAALSCRDEKTAKQAYQIAKRSFETEYGETSSFHFGFTGIDSSVCIEYSKRGWQKTEFFDVDDFEFAETQTEKCFSKEERCYESRYVQKDLDFLRYVKRAIGTLFLGFDVHEVPAEPKPEKPPPWKRIQTVNEETPTPQSDVADCPKQIQALTGAGVPDIIEAYQASIEDSDGTPANVNVVNQLTKADIADGVAEGIMKANALSEMTAGVKTTPPPIESAHADSLYQRQAANRWRASCVIIDEGLEEIGDTTGNPLHTSESPDSPLVAAVKETNEILRERLPSPTTIETESASDSKTPKQRPQRALSELIEMDTFIKKIMPLPKHDNSNSKWITSQRAAKELGITEARLSNQRIKNESVNYKEEDYAGFIIGRSDNGLIWCKSGGASKAIFTCFQK